jgi:nucleoside-diphosphate-sugar epimerase
MTTYLVTGGAGFIGSHIVRALLEDGHTVRVLDNFATGKRENISGLAEQFGGSRFEVREGDVRRAEDLAAAVRGVEVVFHQAAFVSVPQSMEEPTACLDINVQGTAAVLEAARKAGTRRVVMASSAAVYGDNPALPLDEDTELRPLSPYAASKRIDEIYVQLYTQAFGLEAVALRYFNVFGPRQRPDSMYAAAVPIFLRRMIDNQPITIFGDGGQTRDLVYVGDVVRANLAASEHPDAPGKIFNICTGRETRLLDLIEEMQDLFPDAPAPGFAPARAGDIYRSVGDPSKAARTIGFSARTSLAEGLKATAAWMKS